MNKLRILLVYFLLIANFASCTELMYKIKTNNCITTIIISDQSIINQPVDVIVNAANVSLIGSAGVARVVQEAAGNNLITHIQKLPVIKQGGAWGCTRCTVGQSCITPSFDLEKRGVKKIIHTVGPDLRDPQQAQHAQKLLRNCYKTSLELAYKNNLQSIAFPAISTGIFGYDLSAATQIAFEEIKAFIIAYSGAFKEIRLAIMPNNIMITQKIAQTILD